jgi:hypothetical protein
LLNTLEVGLCRRGHRIEIKITEDSRSSSRRALSTCIECRGEIHCGFKEKSESLRILEALLGGH